jgi:hypothetical protein
MLAILAILGLSTLAKALFSLGKWPLFKMANFEGQRMAMLKLANLPHLFNER